MMPVKFQNVMLAFIAWSLVGYAVGQSADAADPGFSAGGLLLRRSNQNDSVLAQSAVDPARQITSDSIDHDFSGGFELSLTKAINRGTYGQLRYFGWFESPSNGSLVTVPGELVQLNSAVPIVSPAGSSIDLRTDSSLHSVEANRLVRFNEDISLIFGVRYLNLSEDLSIGSPDSVAESAATIDTHNNLFGGQVGLDATLFRRDGFSLSLVGKGGLMLNYLEQDSSASTTAATIFSSDSDDEVAFAGELNLRGSMRLNSAASLTAGYQALWLANVVLADDQLGATNFFTNDGLADSGDVLFHGFNLGLQLNY